MLLFIIWSVFTCPSRDGDAAKPIFGARHCKPIFVKIIFKAEDSIVTLALKMNPSCFTAPAFCIVKWVPIFLVLMGGFYQAKGQLAPPSPPPKKSITISDGRSLLGWESPLGEWGLVKSAKLALTSSKTFSLMPGKGILVNGTDGKAGNLISKFQHGDVQAAIEYMVPEGSNSGVYFQGRYELQIFDSYGKNLMSPEENGGIYPRVIKGEKVGGNAPIINASKPPGQWQKFIVIFRAPRFDADGNKVENAKYVKVTHNGQLIHQNVEVEGPTAGAHFSAEKPVGPLIIQGNHGPVAFRRIILKPIKLD